MAKIVLLLISLFLLIAVVSSKVCWKHCTGRNSNIRSVLAVFSYAFFTKILVKTPPFLEKIHCLNILNQFRFTEKNYGKISHTHRIMVVLFFVNFSTFKFNNDNKNFLLKIDYILIYLQRMPN